MNGKKVLLVTGGSRGIGAAIARLAAESGYCVAFSYVSDEQAAEAVAADIKARGCEALAMRGDVGNEEDVLALFQAVDYKFGRLDALVNNAGVVDRKSRVEDMSLDRITRMMRINVIGSILCAREAVKRMSTRNGGSGGAVGNPSSIAAVPGAAEEGIRVNAVRPGVTDTDIHASGGQPDRVRQFAPFIPMKRPATAEEIARAVMFLLSDAASYATGAILDVTGGR